MVIAENQTLQSVKKLKGDIPDLCLNGDSEKLKDNMGYAKHILPCNMLFVG